MSEATRTAAPKRRRGLKITLVTTLVVAGVIGAAALTAVTVAPDWTNEQAGKVVTAVEKQVNEVTGTVPVVKLGPEGGQAEMDWCGDSFIEMVAYRSDANPLPPVFSAHNLCQGRVVLTLDTGSEVDVIDQTGAKKRYVVTEMTSLPPNSTALDLAGISGDLVLQTCNWDWWVKFASLVPAEN